MQAIETTFFGPTNKSPMRIRATCAGKTIIRKFNHVTEASFAEVAKELVELLGWDEGFHGKRWIGGQLKNGNYVFTAEVSEPSFEVGL